MAMETRLVSPASASLSRPSTKLFPFVSSGSRPISISSSIFKARSKNSSFSLPGGRKLVVRACVKVEESNVPETSGISKSQKIQCIVIEDGLAGVLELTPTSKLSQKALLNLVHSKCSNSPHHLKQAHAVSLRTGHFHDHFLAGTFLKYYANRRFFSHDSASKLFNSVPKPNVFIWNTMINACLINNEPWRAVCLYFDMVGVDSWPNKFTFPTVLKACADAGAEREGVLIHSHVVKLGFCGDGHVRSSGIQMYASFGLVSDARRMLDEGGVADVVCYNAMIHGYIKCGDIEAAKELFEEMPRRNVGSWNAIITGLTKCGMVEAAREIFDEMGERDEISWSAMVDGYVQNGCFQEALGVFQLMQAEKVGITKFILSSALAACANVGALDQGRWIHAYARRNSSVQVDSVLGAALVDMYAKCGRLDMAWEVFENVKSKQVFTWNAMIGGLALHGRADDAVGLFEKMQEEKMKPNGITFVNVLNACAHAGWVEEGLSILDSMKNVFGIEPEVEHYGCMVDLFGRAGLFAEAEELINIMPVRPNAAVFGALLGGCRIHGNVELGEKIGELLLELEPQNSGRYALLSNIYAQAGRWDDVAKVRKLMKERGIKTNPGMSMIDVDGVVHKFQMGEGSHPQTKEIYSMVREMMEKLRTEGYSPDSSQVLFDIEEEEKESALEHHSEKLAIGFALLNTPPGTTIRIVKNLRVCQDCHSATKLISRVYDREIVVRDRVRYHHFRNGKCSCNDFW